MFPMTSHLLGALDHEVKKLRELVTATVPDEEVWRLAGNSDSVLITCNRDDFLTLAAGHSGHPGLIVLVRRRSRALERSALVALLDQAGESGIRGNVNFA